MNKTKWKIIAAIVTIGLFVGASGFTGYLLGFSQGMQAGGFSASFTEIAYFHEQMKDQFENANCEELKKTLYDYLEILNRYKGKSSFLSDTLYNGDMMMLEGRLAVIEKKLGNEAQSVEHMKSAIRFCNSRGWDNCTENKVMLRVNHFFEKNPSACLKTHN